MSLAGPKLPAPIVVEVEQVEQVADRRRVLGNVRIVFIGVWVRQIVAAAFTDRRQVPVPFDELQDRNVI